MLTCSGPGWRCQLQAACSQPARRGIEDSRLCFDGRRDSIIDLQKLPGPPPVQVRKGDSIGAFLKAVRDQLAPEFRELRALSTDGMMYIKVRD